MTIEDYAGKVAVVTGAGRGIGRAVVRDLARSGADIGMCSRSPEELGVLAAEVRALGRRVVSRPTDVSEWDQVQAFSRDVLDEFGHVDLLFNNAGTSIDRGPVAESDPATWRQVIDVNLTGVYHVARAFINDMPRGGKILNTGSGIVHGPPPDTSSYTASKAGVHAFTGVLAMEVFEQGICVNTLLPGPVATMMAQNWATGSSEEEILAEFEGKPSPFSPSSLVKPVSEIADFVHYIFSFAETGPTGQIFSLNRRPF